MTLPAGWSWTKVNQIATLIRGVSYKKSEVVEAPKEGFVPILRATNIQDEKLILDSDLVYAPEERVKQEQKLTPGDVVICISSGSKHLVGKAAQLTKEWDGSFGTFCAAARFSPGVNPQYAGFFFSSPNYREEIRKKSSGININNLRASDIAEIAFPLPPLPEQERIVARIEELFTQLDAGVASLRRVQAALKRYKVSVLKAAVEGRLRNGKSGIEYEELPEGWRWVTIGDITASMKNGLYKPREFYADEGVACLRMYNIEDGEIVWKDIKRMVLTEDELETYRLIPGDILVNRVNSRELVGKAAVIPSGLETIVYESKNIRLRIKQDLADSHYINFCFGAFRRNYFNFHAQQVVGMASINQTQISEMPIPLPPLHEQQLIVAEVERRLSLVLQIEAAVEAGLKRAERLRQAILKRAFEGKLVEQHPEDEDA